MHADLVHRLGGAGAVRAAVDDLYARVLADVALLPYFEGVALPIVSEHVADVLVVVLGPDEPGRFSRDQIRTAHADLAITDDAFDGLVGHLLDTLVDTGADDDVVDGAVERVAGLRSLVVES